MFVPFTRELAGFHRCCLLLLTAPQVLAHVKRFESISGRASFVGSELKPPVKTEINNWMHTSYRSNVYFLWKREKRKDLVRRHAASPTFVQQDRSLKVGKLHLFPSVTALTLTSSVWGPGSKGVCDYGVTLLSHIV